MLIWANDHDERITLVISLYKLRWKHDAVFKYVSFLWFLFQDNSHTAKKAFNLKSSNRKTATVERADLYFERVKGKAWELASSVTHISCNFTGFQCFYVISIIMALSDVFTCRHPADWGARLSLSCNVVPLDADVSCLAS